MPPKNIKCKLENLYQRYNQPKYIHPDPIEFLYLYKDIKDREIVGLIASSLAYGRVKQIKYDFVLTRFGIRDDMNIDNL